MELAGALKAWRSRRAATRGPRVHRLDVEVPGLDPAHDGVRVAHVTDLHVGMPVLAELPAHACKLIAARGA